MVLVCQMPSSHKSPGTRANLHTVTIAVTETEPEENMLLLTGPLKRILAYACTCQSGAGNNRACAHVCAVVVGLMAPSTFRSAKKNLGTRTDLFLPDIQQPSGTGPPSEGRN